MTKNSKAVTVATYDLRDIEEARQERDRLRSEQWIAWLVRAGDTVFVMINPPS